MTLADRAFYIGAGISLLAAGGIAGTCVLTWVIAR